MAGEVNGIPQTRYTVSDTISDKAMQEKSAQAMNARKSSAASEFGCDLVNLTRLPFCHPTR